jgi:hypothetical protein
MPFLAESALPSLLPPLLTGNTQQHESIHTPLSQPALPSHTTHLSPTAALDGDGGKHTASLDLSQPYRLVQAFPHTRRHFRQTKNSCTNKREGSSAPSLSKIEGARLYLALSSLSVSLALSTAHHTQPYEHASRHTRHTTQTTQKKAKKTREPLLIFLLQFATQVYSHQSTR